MFANYKLHTSNYIHDYHPFIMITSQQNPHQINIVSCNKFISYIKSSKLYASYITHCTKQRTRIHRPIRLEIQITLTQFNGIIVERVTEQGYNNKQ